MCDPEYRRQLILTGFEEDGGEGILTALREIALTQQINDARQAETKASEAERKAATEALNCGNATSFVTVCEALNALGLKIALVRKEAQAEPEHTPETDDKADTVTPQAIAA